MYPEQILVGLREIANQWQLLPVMRHRCFTRLPVDRLLGVRPSKRLIDLRLGLPLFSVSPFT